MKNARLPLSVQPDCNYITQNLQKQWSKSKFFCFHRLLADPDSRFWPFLQVDACNWRGGIQNQPPKGGWLTKY